jgi:hypothetical protein
MEHWSGLALYFLWQTSGTLDLLNPGIHTLELYSTLLVGSLFIKSFLQQGQSGCSFVFCAQFYLGMFFLYTFNFLFIAWRTTCVIAFCICHYK